MSKFRPTLLVCFLVVLLSSAAGLSAEPTPPSEPPDRPSIALVLGGGGAHGVAHLGVLKELNRQRIPIDLIVGTGLGALIGGLYASAMPIDEIGALLSGTDWEEIFNPDTKREDLSFRRKQDDQDFLIKYKVGVKDGQAQLPTSLVPNDKLSWLLQRVTVSTKGLESFDDLPIPFRATVMDLANGDLVALKTGGLDRAILASLASPGTLPPVQIGDRVFMSGSLLNNLPVDVARDWGADIIIVVDIGVFSNPIEELNNVFRVVGQVAHLVQRRSTQLGLDQMRTTDILIRPVLEPDAETDFSDLAGNIETGQSATAAEMQRIASLRLDDTAYESLVADRLARKLDVPVIHKVALDNQSKVSSDVILANVHQVLDEPLDKVQLESDLRDIYALGSFSSVDFNLREDADGATMEIRTVEDAAAQKFWRFGVSLEDNLKGNNAYTGSASFTWTQINRLNAEWRSVTRIGERQQISTEFYQPVVKSGNWFVSTTAGYVERNVNEFVGGTLTSQSRVEELVGGISAGRVIGKVGEIRIGYSRGTGKSRVNIGDAQPTLDFDIGGIGATASYDNYDNIYFPKRGGVARLSWLGQSKSLGSSIDVDIAAGDAGIARTWGAHTLLAGFTVASQLNEVEGVQNLLSTGGLFNLSGYQRDELSGRHTGVARGIYFRELRSNPLRGFLSATLYVGGSLELGGAWQESDEISFSNTIFAGSLFFGMDTFIGPVYFAGGLAEGGNSALYLFVGRPQ